MSIFVTRVAVLGISHQTRTAGIGGSERAGVPANRLSRCRQLGYCIGSAPWGAIIAAGRETASIRRPREVEVNQTRAGVHIDGSEISWTRTTSGSRIA
jgi:hypothetical protein